jgi:hypothetical protein
MQKNFIPLFFVLFLATTGAAAQVIDTNCATYMRPIFYSAEKGAHFTGSLDDYFKRSLPDKANRQDGAFKIKLIIDSVGKLDCLTIENNTTNYTLEEIRRCISGMPEWFPAMQNGYAVTFCAKIVVTVHKGKKTVSYLNEQPYRPQ